MRLNVRFLPKTAPATNKKATLYHVMYAISLNIDSDQIFGFEQIVLMTDTESVAPTMAGLQPEPLIEVPFGGHTISLGSCE